MGILRYREALNQALREEMRRDETVFLMGEDIGVFNGAFKVTQGLLEEFGEKRVRDTPISENTIVGIGVGAAMTGLRPVVELMTINFSLLAMDQIVNHMATIHYMFGGQAKVPMVVRMPQGAGHQLGPTHSHSLEALYLQVPGMLVAVPSTAADAKGLLKAAIRDDNPVVFIEHEYLYGQRGDVPDEDDLLVGFGQAAVRREGEDVTLVGISRMALTAEKAASALADEHEIERAQRARVDDLAGDVVLLLEQVGRLLGGQRHPRDADERDVLALAHDPRPAEVEREVLVLGHVAALAVQVLVLDEDHRVVVADGRLEQTLGVCGVRRHGDQQAGHVEVECLEAVRVRRAELVAGALGHTDDQRHADLAAEHVVDVGGRVDDLVEREQGEVDRHQLDHRAQADHGRAHAHADDGVLGDRRVAHAPLAELLEQPGRHLEGAVEDADVLAHEEDGLVALHLLAQRGVQRLAVAHHCHERSSSPRCTPAERSSIEYQPRT